MTTINDIAKLAGVAKSTVSRHLNGGSVSRKTAAKIEAVIKQTGYVPNSFAQSLKAKESRMIGVIIPRLDSFSANCILSEIDEVFRQVDIADMLKRFHLVAKPPDNFRITVAAVHDGDPGEEIEIFFPRGVEEVKVFFSCAVKEILHGAADKLRRLLVEMAEAGHDIVFLLFEDRFGTDIFWHDHTCFLVMMRFYWERRKR